MVKNPLKLIIFDCDGVIVDSEPIVMAVFGEGLRELGLIYSQAALFEQFVGPSVDSCYARVEEKLGRPLPNGFMDRLSRKTEMALKQSLKPIPGIPNILPKLSLPYCLASNSKREKIHSCLTVTDLIAYFKDKIYSAVDDVPREKPAPDIYLHVAQAMQVEPQACVVIEDTPTGVKAGVQAGMLVLGYSAFHHSENLLEAGAALTFTDMLKLPEIILSFFRRSLLMRRP